MAVGTILVSLNDVDRAKELLNIGSMLANRHDAHLIGFYVIPAVYIHPGISAHVTADVVDWGRRFFQDRADSVKKIFDEEVKKQGIKGEWRAQHCGAADLGQHITEHALCADLVVMGQTNFDVNRTDQTRVQETVIKGAGCPVLVVPRVGDFKSIGTHALIGWSATRESSRAAHDAMPFLAKEGKATLIWVSDANYYSEHLESTAHAMAQCIDRHGVEATVTRWQNSKIAVGDVLLNEAFERGADMIVTGAYGHSKFYDFVIGATTSKLMEQMTLPILFSN